MTRDWLLLSWRLLLVRGIAAIAFGIAAMSWPVATAIALALLWGVWALMEGVGSIVQAFEPGTPRSARLLLIVMGVIALVAAFFAIFSPAVTAVSLTWILGIWFILRGVFVAAAAFSASTPAPRWLLVLGAALDVLLGILFVANPGEAVVGIAFVLGVAALAWGIVFLVTGLVVRKALADGLKGTVGSTA